MSVALLLIFLGLMALGVPIAISLGAASVIVLITMGNMPLTMAVWAMWPFCVTSSSALCPAPPWPPWPPSAK